MASINFTVFVDKILSGEKQQTIRKPRKVPIRVGDKLHIYTGQRTKECRKLGMATCSEIVPITFNYPYYQWKIYMYYRNRDTLVQLNLGEVPGKPGSRKYKTLSYEEEDKLAIDDGFESYKQFRDFFVNTYSMCEGQEKDFVIIKWNNFAPEVKDVNFVQG